MPICICIGKVVDCIKMNVERTESLDLLRASASVKFQISEEIRSWGDCLIKLSNSYVSSRCLGSDREDA
jgi:hypothetical protein